MNSSIPSVTKPTTTSGEAQRASTWIERFAIPITVSAMEAQPIALLIALLTFTVARTTAASPIGAGGVALIELALLWWTMLVENIVQHSPRGRRMAWLHLLGWLVVLGVMVGPRLPSLVQWENIPAALLVTMLVTWLWRRGMYRVQTGFEYEQFANSFKVSFGVLLGILLIAIL